MTSIPQEFNAITQGKLDFEVVTAARKEYKHYYEIEEELNRVFDSFVHYYQLAYQGPNTLKGQIDARVKNASKRSKQNYHTTCT